MNDLRESEERMDQYDQDRKNLEWRLANMTDAYAVLEAELKECRRVSDTRRDMAMMQVEIVRERDGYQSTAKDLRVAFTAGWQNATGYYSGKQVWDIERCWEQFLKDKDEVM